MSILDDLRIDQSVYPGNMSYAHNCAIDAVAEALLTELDRLAADEHTAVLDGGFFLGWNEALAEVRRAVVGGDDDPSSPHSPARLSDPLRKYREPHAPRDNCGPACNHEGYEAAGGSQ